MINKIKQFCQRQQRVSVAELSTHFKCEVSFLEPILSLLVRKGYLRCEERMGCAQCPVRCQSIQCFYIWAL